MKSQKLIFITFALFISTVASAREEDLETLALQKIERQKTPRIIQVPMYQVQFPSKPVPGVKYPLFVPQ